MQKRTIPYFVKQLSVSLVISHEEPGHLSLVGFHIEFCKTDNWFAKSNKRGSTTFFHFNQSNQRTDQLYTISFGKHTHQNKMESPVVGMSQSSKYIPDAILTIKLLAVSIPQRQATLHKEEWKSVDVKITQVSAWQLP